MQLLAYKCGFWTIGLILRFLIEPERAAGSEWDVSLISGRENIGDLVQEIKAEVFRTVKNLKRKECKAAQDHRFIYILDFHIMFFLDIYYCKFN